MQHYLTTAARSRSSSGSCRTCTSWRQLKGRPLRPHQEAPHFLKNYMNKVKWFLLLDVLCRLLETTSSTNINPPRLDVSSENILGLSVCTSTGRHHRVALDSTCPETLDARVDWRSLRSVVLIPSSCWTTDCCWPCCCWPHVQNTFAVTDSARENSRRTEYCKNHSQRIRRSLSKDLPHWSAIDFAFAVVASSELRKSAIAVVARYQHICAP